MAADGEHLAIPSAEERLAGRLAAQQPRRPTTARTMAITGLTELGQIDRAVYLAVADGPVRRLAQAADHSRLWIGIAASMAAMGGRDGRRAAGVGLVAVAVNSAVVNLGFKLVARRSRPDRVAARVPVPRHVPMPHSASFPSGHAASAFVFADTVGQTLPAVASPLRLLAGAVGYSRVHTGVHYPGDVVLGALIGSSIGELVGWGLRRASRPGPEGR